VLLLIAILIGASSVSAQTSLPELAEKQQWDLLAEALKESSDFNEAQPDGMTALHWAARNGHRDSVTALLNRGADVDSQTEYSVTPLSLACEIGDASIIKILTNAGADVEIARLSKERPLMITARNGDAESVCVLIEHGAELDAKETGGQTALMWAAAAGNAEAVDELVKAGADINAAVGDSGFTAFHFAARQGKTNVVERLIDAGFDVNAVMNTRKAGGRKPRKNMSAMLLAIESGHLELALRLVELGADPNDQRSGFAPLHAISWVRRTQLGDNPEGDPPPRITGSVNSLEFVSRMLDAGAEVNLRVKNGKAGKAKLNPKGMTPFMFAAATVDLPMMKLLLERGADPTIANADGCTALMACAGIGVFAVGEHPGTEEEVDAGIRLLVKLGLDLDVVDSNGETAMHGAAYRNYPSAVRTLDECGADPKVWNQKNKLGATPRMVAAGKRPGSLKPSPPTIAAIDSVLQARSD
jgi:ankyrin repeat protein